MSAYKIADPAKPAERCTYMTGLERCPFKHDGMVMDGRMLCGLHKHVVRVYQAMDEHIPIMEEVRKRVSNGLRAKIGYHLGKLKNLKEGYTPPQ